MRHRYLMSLSLYYFCYFLLYVVIHDVRIKHSECAMNRNSSSSSSSCSRRRRIWRAYGGERWRSMSSVV